MRKCWLKIDGDEEGSYEVKAKGYGSFQPGDELEVRSQNCLMRPSGWCRVRIVAYLDHIGSRCNRGGALYSAILLRDYPNPAEQGQLF